MLLRCLAFLMVLATALGLDAAPLGYRSYFNYPDVEFVATHGTGGTNKMFPWNCHPGNPKDSPVVFTGGDNDPVSKEQHDWKYCARWRFLGKSGTGDSYRVTIYRNDAVLKEIPVLYQGKSVLVYYGDQLSVNFIAVVVPPPGVISPDPK